MGSGRDKRKAAKEKKAGPTAGKGADKTERKTHKNELKREKRADKRLAGDEDDLDALLAKFALEEKQHKAVQVIPDCEPPSPRVNASFVPYVTQRGTEIILFGGERADVASGKVYCYNHLYRFATDKQRWTQVVAPKGPTPRCAHQAVIHKSHMFVWGGEFSSPNQERFMHFRDLWRLDLNTHEWEQLPLRGGPSARSGHRMVALKGGKVLLFGGFYDNGRDVKYYNDLWELDVGEMVWTPVGDMAAGPWPPARSGCQLMLGGAAAGGDAATVYMYGGYVKDKDEEDEDLEHGKAHDDMWALDTKTYKWERVKKAGMAPGPRSSFAMVPHKNRAFLFGGVSDNETKRGEDLSSEFHNDLYTFSFANRRWFAAQLRPPKDYQQQQQQQQVAAQQTQGQQDGQQQQPGQPASAAAGTSSSSNGSSSSSKPVVAASKEVQRLIEAGQDKDSPAYKAAVRIQSRFRGYVVRKAYKLYQLGGVVSEILYSPAAFGLDMSARNMPKPRARISPLVCVTGNTLWLLGGIVEVGDAEVTLDDMWCLDLAKLDGWQLLKENSSAGEEALKRAGARRAAAKKKGGATGAAAAGSDDSEWEEADTDEEDE